jgi:hypothetical protein
MPLTIEVIPDPELGGFTARLPDIPATAKAKTKTKPSTVLRRPSAVTPKRSGWMMH